MNFAYWSSWVFHRLLDSRLDRHRLRLFGWCLNDRHVLVLFLLVGFVIHVVLQIPHSLLLRGQNTICGFQQKEAGVTPEARRDRAAILRRDGVAPASGRVLAALHFLAVSVASACSFCLLSPCPGLKSEVKSPVKDVSSELFTGIFTAQCGCRSNSAACPFTVEKIKLTCEGVRNLRESDRTAFSVISARAPSSV